MYHGERKYTYQSVPKEISDKLDELIEEQNLECADNYRFSPVDDNEGMTQFDAIEESGCCGSFNSEYTDSNGIRWLIGCNYGH